MENSYEVSTDDVRRSARDIDSIVNDFPGDVTRRVQPNVTYGHGGVEDAMRNYMEGLEASIGIIHDTASSASEALKGVAMEYEKSDEISSETMRKIEDDFSSGMW